MTRGLEPLRSYLASSLARGVVLRLGLVAALAMAALMALADTFATRELQSRLLDELRIHLASRARDANDLFSVAQRNTELLHDEYLRRLARPDAGEHRRGFQHWFERQPDGLVRVRRELDDHRTLPSLYLRPQVATTDDVQARTWHAFQLLKEWGPASTVRYYSVYFDLPGEGLIMYSPSVNWGAQATPETNNFDYPPVAGASPEKNPQRANRWTPVYFDDKAGIYMVSTVRPIDLQGRWIACVSQDVAIDDLIERTYNERLQDSYNVILSRAGELIAHPHFQSKLQAAQGNLSLAALKDPLLNELATLAVPQGGDVLVKASADGRHFFGAAAVAGPDWVMVTVVPAQLLSERVQAASRVVVLSGLGALLLILLMLRWVVQRQIGRPLHALQDAAQRVAQGDYQVNLDRRRPDELGQLAGAFADMGAQLTQREAALKDQLLKLQASERRFRLVFDRSPLPLALVRNADGRVADANSSALQTLGLRRDDTVGRRVFELGLWGRRPRWLAVLRRLRRGGEVDDAPVDLQAADGSTRLLRLSSSRIELDGADYSLVSLRDVTPLQQAEAEAHRLQAQLRESQKMEAVGTLAGGIAHDFNNILGAMLGNLSLAQGDLPSGHPARLSLDQAQRSALRARALVRQILTFSRHGTQQMRQCTLGPLVLDVLQLLRATFPAAVALDLRVPPDALVVQADESQMQQVLMNLCTNALHALPGARGRIEVGLAAADLVQGVAPCPPGLPSGSYVQLWVQDDGVGMDAATRERVFEPFFTTKPVGQGTGLGLAVVHGIVKAHQGAIVVNSAPGAGARLDVWLPRADPAAQAADAVVAEASPPPGGGGRVLYLDDDEVMVAMVERLLVRDGFHVQCAARAGDALALLSRDPAAFDVVVTDFNMPGMNGAEFAQAVRALNPALPVVMSSGYVDDAVRQAAQEAGVVAVLYKEDSFLALAGLLRQVLGQVTGQGGAAQPVLQGAVQSPDPKAQPRPR